LKNTTAVKLLKIVLSASALVLLFIICWCLPRFMEQMVHIRASLQPWVIPMVAYGVLISLPVFTSIVFLWQVFNTIPTDAAFSRPNARRFRLIAWLAAGDLALVLVLLVFLLIAGVIPAFVLLSLIAVIYVGVVAIIVFHVLAALVTNAAILQQDSELTI
jgi:hypothetical protein